MIFSFGDMEKMNTLVFTIALGGYALTFEECIKSQKEYCARMGFKFVLVEKVPQKIFPAEAAWLKIILLEYALRCDYDWLAFIDADCEIRNHAPSFVEEIKKFDENKSIFMAHGFSGRINSGVIFLRNNKDSRNYLQKVIKNMENKIPEADQALYENGHMIHYARGNPSVQIVDYSLWNNNRYHDEKAYIQHFSGGILRNRYLERTKQINKINLFDRILKKINSRIVKKKTITLTQSLQELLPSLLEEYPAFDCGPNI